ncbi:deoxyribose-phosphate aldolase [Stomatohabitans albus]|uniref:deoxyribose-phosphate aldolase n=1 Tax=Stomatohabitans albus TaxID=3110766 RepID=UPI00300C023A
MALSPGEFAAMVDHTLLKPEATRADIETTCQEAVDMATKSVCVNSMWVSVVANALVDSPVLTCTVVGFPLGAMNIRGLISETAQAIDDGADEVDMVLPFGAVLGGDWDSARNAISAVREACEGKVLKVILESRALGLDLTAKAAQLSVDLGADFVKTSTGFHSSGGADAASVQRMRDVVGPHLGVKASGGVRTLDDVNKMIAAGANRLGMSATKQVFAELLSV